MGGNRLSFPKKKDPILVDWGGDKIGQSVCAYFLFWDSCIHPLPTLKVNEIYMTCVC